MTGKKISKRLFGTNGVRGIAGLDLTPDLVSAIGRALGHLRPGRIAIGRDTRTSGETFSHSVTAGLLASGCEVHDCGILPTPALQYLVRDGYDAGAMITASHNPPEYNGIKIIEPDGTEMGDEETLALEALIFDTPPPPVPWDRAGHKIPVPHLVRNYTGGVVRHFPGLPGKGMTVVVDPGSGPACITTPVILREIGCRVLTINGVMDGTFPGRMPEPSADGLVNLAHLVTSAGAAFGVAHDGDADRAVFVDERGNFVEENAEFAILARAICRQMRGTVVTPVSSGQVVEEVVKKEGSTIRYTPVGSIYVARTMRNLIRDGEPVIFGGEGNGGLIFPGHQFCRDGGMTAAAMVALLSSSGEPLSRHVRRLPRRFVLKDKIAATGAQEILAALPGHYPRATIDRTDGVKIFTKDAWALVRASGTEPVIRIIIDAKTRQAASAFHRDLTSRLADAEP